MQTNLLNPARHLSGCTQGEMNGAGRHDFMRASSPSSSIHASRVGLGAVIALHAIAVMALFSYEPTRSAMIQAMPIMVEFITPQPEHAVKLPQPKPVPAIQPPRPVQAQQQPVVPAVAPTVTAATNAPSPVTTPAPTMAPAATPPASTDTAMAAPEITVTPPAFNAAYLNNPAPAYPPASRRMREQGQVVLRVLVNASGRADDVQLRTSSGFSRLDDVARETVRDWKFAPARRGSEAIAAWVLIPISFKMEG